MAHGLAVGQRWVDAEGVEATVVEVGVWFVRYATPAVVLSVPAVRFVEQWTPVLELNEVFYAGVRSRAEQLLAEGSALLTVDVDAPKPERMFAEPYYKTGAGLSLETLQRAIQEIHDAELDPYPGYDDFVELRDRLPAGWEERLEKDEVLFLWTYLNHILHGYVTHPRTAQKADELFAELVAKAAP